MLAANQDRAVVTADRKDFSPPAMTLGSRENLIELGDGLARDLTGLQYAASRPALRRHSVHIAAAEPRLRQEAGIFRTVLEIRGSSREPVAELRVTSEA